MEDTLNYRAQFDNTQVNRAFDQLMAKVRQSAAVTSRDSATIRAAFERINNVQVRSALLDGLNRQMAEARGNAQRTSSSVSGSLGGVGRGAGLAQAGIAGFAGGLAAMGVGMAISALKGLANGFMEASDKAGAIEAKLRLATDAFGSYAQAQRDVRQIAADTRGDLGAVTDLYTTMARNARNLGLTQAQVATATTTVSRAFKISGASSQETAGALRQLSQAMATGKLSGDEFNSIAENSPRLMQLFADALGKPRGELKKMASEGKLTGEVIAKAVTDPKLVKQIEKEYGRIPVSFADIGTAASNMGTILAGAFSKGMGTGSSLGNFLEKIKNITESLEGPVTALGRVFGAIGNVIGTVFSGIGQIWTAISSGAPGGLSILESLSLYWNILAEGANTLATVVSEVFSLIAGVVGPVAQFIGDVFGKVLSFLGISTASTGQSMGASFIGILRAVKVVVLAIPRLFAAAFQDVMQMGAAFGKAIALALTGDFSGFGAVFKGAFGRSRAVAMQAGKDAVGAFNDGARNQRVFDTYTNRYKAPDDPSKPAGKPDPKSKDKKKGGKDKESEEQKKAEEAAKKYADAVQNLKDRIADLALTEEQKALADEMERAGLSRDIKQTNEKANAIRKLFAELKEGEKQKKVKEVLDDFNKSIRELGYSEMQLAQVEARRRAGLPEDLAVTTDLTRKVDAQAAAYYRLQKAKQEAQAIKDIEREQQARREDQGFDQQARTNPEAAEDARRIAQIERDRVANREKINALQGITDAKRAELLATEDVIAAQDKQAVMLDRQQQKVEALSGFMEKLWENPKEAMRQFFKDLMKKLFEAILRAIILGEKLGGGGGIGGLIGNAITGALGIGGGRATGGSVARGDVRMVGENGPELVSFGAAGQVFNANATRRAMGAGGMQVSFGETNMHFSGPVSNQTKAELKAMQAQQQRENIDAMDAWARKRGII